MLSPSVLNTVGKTLTQAHCMHCMCMADINFRYSMLGSYLQSVFFFFPNSILCNSYNYHNSMMLNVVHIYWPVTEDHAQLLY